MRSNAPSMGAPGICSDQVKPCMIALPITIYITSNRHSEKAIPIKSAFPMP